MKSLKPQYIVIINDHVDRVLTGIEELPFLFPLPLSFEDESESELSYLSGYDLGHRDLYDEFIENKRLYPDEEPFLPEDDFLGKNHHASPYEVLLIKTYQGKEHIFNDEIETQDLFRGCIPNGSVVFARKDRKVMNINEYISLFRAMDIGFAHFLDHFYGYKYEPPIVSAAPQSIELKQFEFAYILFVDYYSD